MIPLENPLEDPLDEEHRWPPCYVIPGVLIAAALSWGLVAALVYAVAGCVS